MSTLLQKIVAYFRPSKKSDVEKFIESGNPQNVAEVENLLQQYYNLGKWGL